VIVYMNTFFKVCLLVTILTISAISEPVVRVDKIYGEENLYIQRSGAGEFFRAFLEQNGEIGDHFRTDTDSMASLRFFLGGLANLGKGCELAVISEKQGEVVSEGVEVTKGAIWAKFGKHEDKPVKIKTAGGVMGIRGTEFVVQVDNEGNTKFTLLEGNVSITPVQGDPIEVEASEERGPEITFGPNTPLLTKLYGLAELRERLREDLGPAFEELQVSLENLRRELREADLQVRLAETRELTGNIDDRLYLGLGKARRGAQTAEDALNADSTREGLEKARDITSRIDEILAGAGQSTETESAPPSPKPMVNTPHPEISWESLGADRYAVLILHPSNDDLVYWLDETEDTSYRHPEDAKPLTSGLYRFRIIPVNSDGRPAGDAYDAPFVVKE